MNKTIRYSKSFVLSLSLILIGCGSGGGGTTPAPQLPVAPTPPPVVLTPNLAQNKLLSDAELETTPLSTAPTVNAAYANWLRDNHYPIRSITYDQDFSDLDFLKGLIGGKSLVQLGESSHGTKEFNHVKTRIIKFLHQEMDFSVIAMESGFFDGIHADSIRETASADSLMRFIFGVWQTNEVLELFQYVKETQSGSKPLRLIGFDTQISSSYYNFIGGYVDATPVSTNFSQALKDTLKTDLETFKVLQDEFSQQSCLQQRSTACQTAIDQMANLKTSLMSAQTSLSSISAPTERQKVLSISTFAAIGQIDNSTTAYARGDSDSVRDFNMASIVSRIRKDIYPNEKVIIWAHNRHVAHQQSATAVASGNPYLIQRTTGYHLKNELQDDLYTIGLYMLRGSTADNSRRPVRVIQPRNDSVEALAHSVKKAAIFIDTQINQNQVDGNKFLFEPIDAHYWGGSFGSYRMIPSDQFDGLLVIDQSSLPSYR